MINRFIFFFIIFIPLFLKSEYSWNRSPASPIVDEGIQALYNYQLDHAIQLLDSAKKIDSSHPVIPFILISAKWLKTQIKEGYFSSYETINNEVEQAIPIYEQLIKENPADPEQILYLGSAYGLRARTAMANKNWLDVLYFGLQGLKYIRKSEKMDKMLFDVYMPIGTMEYFACVSSAPIKWGSKLIGLSADCEQGKKHLEIAVEKSYYSWIEASNVLAYIYLHIERDYENAANILNPLVEKFPRHPYFTLLKGELLAKTKKWIELESIMTLLKSFATSGSPVIQNECELKVAYIQALREFDFGNYTLSNKMCKWIIENYEMEFDWLRGFTYLLRGKTHDMLGKRKLAIKDYKETIKMDNYYPEVEEAKLFLHNPYVFKK